MGTLKLTVDERLRKKATEVFRERTIESMKEFQKDGFTTPEFLFSFALAFVIAVRGIAEGMGIDDDEHVKFMDWLYESAKTDLLEIDDDSESDSCPNRPSSH